MHDPMKQGMTRKQWRDSTGPTWRKHKRARDTTAVLFNHTYSGWWCPGDRIRCCRDETAATYGWQATGTVKHVQHPRATGRRGGKGGLWWEEGQREGDVVGGTRHRPLLRRRLGTHGSRSRPGVVAALVTSCERVRRSWQAQTLTVSTCDEAPEWATSSGTKRVRDYLTTF